ncbi:MAG TPA: MarR family winged helix-turn-helix transcriptional regulator [Usitatibacter sp.]|jgi:DNA-binding MarR family transcriptional regulator|nr:MarR family winged helix-turn-helix transcriptional regulator [Usitatibacter sp.]
MEARLDKNPIVLLELVERLGNLMRTELRRAGADESLQPVHLQSLIYLSKANRYSNTPQALAEYLGLTKGTVSQTLLLLDRRGLIERFEDDIDRRVVRLRLSPSGERLLYEAQPTLAWQNATRNISPNRIRNAVSALREALMTLQEDNEGAPFGVCHSCSWCQKLSQRIYRCGRMGDRLSGPETRKICRIYEAKNAEEAA